MDSYATAYAIALTVTMIVSLVVRSPARVYGAGLLVAAWLMTIALQNMTGVIAHPVVFAFITFALVLAYAAMGFLFDRMWAWIASGLHVVMLFVHLAYQMTPGASSFVYISFLTALCYLTMIAITATPLWRIIGGKHGRKRTSYHGFMRGGCVDPLPRKAPQEGAPR